MKNLKFLYKSILAVATIFLMVGCEEDTYTFGSITAPSNIQITTEVVGQDASNPNGDGSGTVHFTVTADDAITYKYIFNGNQAISANGKMTYNFSNTGTETYTVTVIAVGTGGTTSTAVAQEEVLVLYDPPTDLLEMLHGGSTKTWRLKAESAGHFGVGPADSATPDWWAAAPNDKDGKGAYDDRFVFNSDGSFTHITNGTIFGQSGPLTADFGGDQGFTANGDGEFENFTINDYNDTWSLSAPGGQETLTFASLGYHGFYVGGNHSYAILSRSSNEMSIRTTGADGLGWFAILVVDE